MADLEIVKKLEAEIEALDREFRITLPRLIREAAAQGDISDNAEYRAAKQRQEFVNARIGHLKQRLSGLALVNLRKDLMDLEGWNTLSVRVEGQRVQVWLNGQEIGAVRAAGPAKGKIGLYIAGARASKSSQLCIREVLVQKITSPEERTSTPSAN